MDFKYDTGDLSKCPPVDTGAIVRQKIMRGWARQRVLFMEWQLLDCLGQWVSECEPQMIVAGNGELLGIGLAGDPSARIVIPAPGVPSALLPTEFRFNRQDMMWKWP